MGWVACGRRGTQATPTQSGAWLCLVAPIGQLNAAGLIGFTYLGNLSRLLLSPTSTLPSPLVRMENTNKHTQQSAHLTRPTYTHLAMMNQVTVKKVTNTNSGSSTRERL